MTSDPAFWIFIGVTCVALVIIGGFVALVFVAGFLFERGISFNSAKMLDRCMIFAAALLAKLIIAIASRITKLIHTFLPSKGEPPHA